MLRKGMKLAMGIALVAVLAAVSPAVAAEPRPREMTVDVVIRDVGTLWSRAWQWVESLWGEQSPAKAGICVDPNGAPCQSSTTSSGPTGDPDH